MYEVSFANRPHLHALSRLHAVSLPPPPPLVAREIELVGGRRMGGREDEEYVDWGGRLGGSAQRDTPCNVLEGGSERERKRERARESERAREKEREREREREREFVCMCARARLCACMDFV
jgi:hypothetical protein